MKNIKNKKLQQICEQELNLKDIVLNFDDGLVYIYSDDVDTSYILAQADTSIVTGESGAVYSFKKYSIQQWFDIIKMWYKYNLEPNLEDRFIKKSHWIRVISIK